ncbi:MAG TPA: hypothetical protein VMQ62_06580 [Dongiaceae bacterium]|nr:hypothetical protein [Dongiaceae bacterium]
MARTRKADYDRSNRVTRLALRDSSAATIAADGVLAAGDAAGRQAAGQRLIDLLAAQTGIPTPEVVVPDQAQPHRRAGGRIVYSLQGDYRRRQPSPADSSVARGGRPLGRIRVLHRTPARGAVVKPEAFLHTLLHEFCHHHDAESLGLLRSFHTKGFYARLRQLREQTAAAGRDDRASAAPAPALPRGRAVAARTRRRRPTQPAAAPMLPGAQLVLPFLDRLWSIIRRR